MKDVPLRIKESDVLADMTALLLDPALKLADVAQADVAKDAPAEQEVSTAALTGRRPNGKAERFIQTLITSRPTPDRTGQNGDRLQPLRRFVDFYNHGLRTSRSAASCLARLSTTA